MSRSCRFTDSTLSEISSGSPDEKREATKHVESFGVGFWIRVQFSAPPPNHKCGSPHSQRVAQRQRYEHNYSNSLNDCGTVNALGRRLTSSRTYKRGTPHDASSEV